jgi:AcrR family transcriptional regulator
MNHSVIICFVARRPTDRLDQVMTAALRVFGDKGYRRTQMADVAREMGVSPGTLYNYVTSKEALFHLVIDRAFAPGHSPATPPLPIPAPPPGATLARLRERLIADTALPSLDAALRRTRVADARAELEAVVRELYERLERAWPGIVVLERSALEMPELAPVFYAEMRRGLLDRLERYLTTRMRAGGLRPAPGAVAARFLLETIAWFAMHRHRDPLPAKIDDHTAREAAVGLIVNALAPTGRWGRTRKERTR